MIKKITYFLIIASILNIGCSNNSVSKQQVISTITSLEKLSTTEFTISKIIRANDNKNWYTIGDRKIAISFEAKIKAGIDLSKIDGANVTIKEKNITVILPKATITSINILPEKIKEEYTSLGFFRDKFSIEETNQFLQQAQAQVESSLPNIGVLKMAEENAIIFMQNFCKQLGFKNVVIKFDEIKTKNKNLN